MQKILTKILPILRNKYYVTLIAFVIWIVFFDSNNIFEISRYRRDLVRLQHEKQFFLDETQKVNFQKQELFSSEKSLEKFARERYFMKRDDEDIFIFEPAAKEKE